MPRSEKVEAELLPRSDGIR